jgi:hypothetical protein
VVETAGAGDAFNPEKIFPAAAGPSEVVPSQRVVVQILDPDAYV